MGVKENKLWRENLDKKHKILCNKARKIISYKEKNMALQTTAAKAVKGWTKGKLLGFRESKTGEYFIGKFRLENGDFCSMVYNNPIKLVDINKLVTAMGLETFNAADEITLPEEEDADMMGMDVDIMINVKQNGDFLNANGFKSTAQDFDGQF